MGRPPASWIFSGSPPLRADLAKPLSPRARRAVTDRLFEGVSLSPDAASAGFDLPPEKGGQ